MLAAHLDNSQLEQARRRARIWRSTMPDEDLGQQREQEQVLLNAAAQGNLVAVQELLADGVDANAISEAGRTALIVAAWRGHYKVLQTLVAAGVDMDAADHEGIRRLQTMLEVESLRTQSSPLSGNSARQHLSVKQLSERTGFSAKELEEFDALGLVTIYAKGRRKRIRPADVAVADALSAFHDGAEDGWQSEFTFSAVALWESLGCVPSIPTY